MGDKPTIEQICEWSRLIETGVVTRQNFESYLRNLRVLEVQAAITGGEAASVATVVQVAPVITGGQVASEATVVQVKPWTRSLSDAEVLEFYANRTDQRTGMTVAELLPRVREMFTAEDNSYTGPVVVHRRLGYTLKAAAVQEGPCSDNFTYLQNWEFPDAAGPEVLIFGAPVVLKSLFEKDYTKEHKEMRRLEKKFGLPNGFLSFGTAQDSSALMLAGLREQSIHVGGSDLVFRTETKLASGPRLILYWSRGFLYCKYGNYDNNAARSVGGLPQGVVVLGSSAA